MMNQAILAFLSNAGIIRLGTTIKDNHKAYKTPLTD